jgi:UbiD family decarboxylase
MGADLRTFLEQVRQKWPEDWQIVKKAVDPQHEITGLVVRLEKEKRRPVVLFERVKGSPFPVVTNVHSRARLALAMRSTPREMVKDYLAAMERPIPPREVATGPVKEVLQTGSDVNLLELPQIVHHQQDGGPYITAAISFAQDPETGLVNCAYNRLMFKGRDTTSIHLSPAKHLWEFYTKAEKTGKPLQVAFVIGAHPAWALGALAIGSIVEDETAIMGALLGEPLEMVRCATSDLLVPAGAELVLEAEILPHVRMDEGPFGEFTGYALGTRQREVVKVKAISRRRDMMFQDIAVGHLDHMVLSTSPIEANLFRAVRTMVPSVTAVRVPAPFTVFVSIEQKALGQGMNAALAVLGSDIYFKQVIVVDHDVDIFDDGRVIWAVGTRCQPNRDICIINQTRGTDLDPSVAVDGVTSKIAIDATAKPSLEAFTPRHFVPPDVLARMNPQDWLA